MLAVRMLIFIFCFVERPTMKIKKHRNTLTANNITMCKNMHLGGWGARRNVKNLGQTVISAKKNFSEKK